MAVELQERHLKVYCPTHKVSFSVLAAGRLVCESGDEALAKDFPYEEFWEYCCDCLNFWPSSLAKGHEADDNCPSCSRKISQRYLCDRCKVISVKSEEFVTGRPFTLLPNGLPQPACPGCSTRTRAAMGTHDCYIVYTSYTTGRRQCPFCYEAIARNIIADKSSARNGKGGGITPSGDSEESRAGAAAGQEGQNGVAKHHGLRARLGTWLRKKFSPQTRLWFRSHKRRMELIAIIGFILSIGGFVLSLFAFPGIYSILSSTWGKLRTNPPILKSIEYDKREVQAGENISLKAAFEPQTDLKPQFKWSCSLPGRIEGTDENAILNTSGITLLAAPLKVIVGLEITDIYGRSDSRELEVYIVPSAMLNKSPILKTIKCNCTAQEIHAGESVSLTAIAEDPDGDQLSYEWRSSTGQIEPQGESATLKTVGINPESSFTPVKVTVTVNDKRGSSVSNDIVINVVPKQSLKDAKEAPLLSAELLNNPPILISLQPDKSVVETGGAVKLDALAVDPNSDKLIYEWDASKGQIEGSGPSVILKTGGIDPSRDSGRVIVTLTVRDGRGASVSGKAIITVTSPPMPKTPTPTPTVTPTAALLKTPAATVEGKAHSHSRLIMLINSSLRSVRT